MVYISGSLAHIIVIVIAIVQIFLYRVSHLYVSPYYFIMSFCFQTLMLYFHFVLFVLKCVWGWGGGGGGGGIDRGMG